MLHKILNNQALPIYQFFRGFTFLELSLFFIFQLLIVVLSVYFPIAIPALIFITLLPYAIHKRPELGILAIFFFLMLITQPNFPLVTLGGIKIQDILLIIIIGFWITEYIVSGESFQFDKSLLSIAMTTFVAVGIISFFIGILYGSQFRFLYEDLKEFIYLILFWYIINKIKARGQIKLLIIGLLIIINLFSVYSLLMKFLNLGISADTKELRFVLPTTVYLPIGIILITSLWLYNNKLWHKSILIAALILPVAALILSFTRGHWGASIVGILFVILFARIKKKLRTIFILLIMGGIALTLIALLTGFSVTTLWEGVSRRGGESLGIDISLAMRVQEIGLIIREFPNHPFFGHGLGATIFMFRPFRGWVHWWDIHNNYFEFLYEMGLVGVAAYFFLVYAFFKRCYQIFKKITDKYFEALILGFAGTYVYLMVVSLTSGFIFRIDTIPYIAVMMGLVIVIDRLDAEAKTTNA